MPSGGAAVDRTNGDVDADGPSLPVFFGDGLLPEENDTIRASRVMPQTRPPRLLERAGPKGGAINSPALMSRSEERSRPAVLNEGRKRGGDVAGGGGGGGGFGWRR